MPFKPTVNILLNRVDLYRYAGTLDADNAPQGDDGQYTLVTASIKCSVQPQDPERLTDQERVSAKSVWKVVFASNPGAVTGDQLRWTDDAGAVRRLYVVLCRNLAGRGNAWEIRAEERT